MDRPAAATKEYSVKLSTDQTTRSHIMKFGFPGGLDITKLDHPRLERQLPVGVVQEDTAPEFGAGSEYGKKQREEARRRKRGIFRKAQSADDFPWQLRSGKKKDKSKYTGRKEGGVQQSASYFLFREVDGDTFEAVPVHSWYNFTPEISYSTLTAEEAEEQFELRNKTVNHFAVMVQKRMQDSAEGEDKKGSGEPSPSSTAGRNVKNLMGDRLQVREDEDWAESESDSGGSDKEGSSKPKKAKPSAGKKGKKKAAVDSEDSEPGDEQSDDPDVEQSKEVDYMSDESSDDEKTGGYAADAEPKLAKQKEQNDTNDASDSHSETWSSDDEDSEDDLTKSGRETKKLLSKLTGSDGSSDDEEEDEEEDYDQLAKKLGNQNKQTLDKAAGLKGGRDSPKPGSQTETPVPSPAPERRGKVPSKGKTKSGAAGSEEPAPKKKRPAAPASAPAAAASQLKTAAKDDVVTEEAVRRYLSRKPMTTKDLLKKFKGKTDMDGEKLVMVLGEILRKINPDREKVRDKTLLSIKA